MLATLVPRVERLPRPLVRFEREFENLMHGLLGPEERGWLNGFVPAANIAETETGYEVTMELPGMKPEEFNVEFKNGQLWISGEKREEKEEKGKTFHRVEPQARRIPPRDPASGRSRPGESRSRVQGRRAEGDGSQNGGGKASARRSQGLITARVRMSAAGRSQVVARPRRFSRPTARRSA